MGTERVLGVDACKGGWLGIALHGGTVTGYQATTIQDLAAAADADGRLAVIAIDIPIGLPDEGERAADREARKAVGGKLASSVFTAPVRGALAVTPHQVASQTNREHGGKGLSIQAYSIMPRIREVDAWVRRADRGVAARVVEVHPEVSFATIAGGPLTLRKSGWAGLEERRQLLRGQGIEIPANLDVRAAVDDVLDAAVAAWTALRVRRGKAETIPANPQVFSDGLTCAIWR